MRPISSKGAVPWLLAVLLAAVLPACFAARPADTKEEAEVSGADVGASTDVAGLADADVPQVAADGDAGLPPADGVAEVVDVDGLGDVPAELDGLADVAAEVDGSADAGGDVSPVADAGPEVQGADAEPGPDVGTDAADSGSEVQACVPASEQCNGKDDDCDGLTDEAGAEDSCVVVAACAKALCVAGACLDVPSATASGACSDNNACTTADVCTGGSCVGELKVCKDGEPCTDDGCDVVKGCVFSATSAPCSDGNACTVSDICQTGSCAGGQGLACSDGNPCTADACDKASGCTFLPASATCTDGDACTASDTCQGGVCVPGKTATCDDGNACTKDACDKGICSAPPLTGPCDDGDACTLPGTCSQGKCVLVAKDCNDQDVCTADSCDKVSGSCKHAAVVGCGKAACGGQADCKTGKCDVVTHACLGCLVHADCAGGQVCKGGACVPGVQCASTSQCKATAQVCDAVGGLCVDCLAESDCGAGKTCLAKACVQKTTCVSDTACPAVCAKALGVCAECNVAADCAGKGWCAADHTCHAPVCLGNACLSGSWFQCAGDGSAYGAGKSCDDGNDCTADTCDVVKGCGHSASSLGAACPGGLCDGKGGCKGVVKVATSERTTCAIDMQGQLWCWGWNGYGQIGDGTTLSRSFPGKVQGLEGDIVDVAVSMYVTCALNKAGKLWCWGNNSSGQLGTGSTGQQANPKPMPVQAVPACAAVAVGHDTACALGKDASVWCWGATNLGQTGVGVQGDGATQPSPKQLSSLGAATALTAGYHFCALLQTGTVSCWGNNDSGQIGNGKGAGPGNLPTPWPATVLQLADVAALGSAASTTCAVKKDGSVWCWGANGAGELGVGKSVQELKFSNVPVLAGISGVSALAGASGTLCALRQDKSVWCWGSGYKGALGIGLPDWNSPAPVQVKALSGVTGVAGRCAIVTDGRLYCWGSNDYGEAGDGTTPGEEGNPGKRLQPGDPVALSGISAIAAGASHACAIAGGKVLCWGSNGSGQLGHGGLPAAPAPVPVKNLPDDAVVSLAAGWSTTCAALASGKVWCWGDNQYGQLGAAKTESSLPMALEPVPAVKVLGLAQQLSLGTSHACALVGAGLIECWGQNQVGEAGTTGVAGVLEVVAGGHFTCARLAGGKVQCWGDSYGGKLGDGNSGAKLAPGVTVGGSQTAVDLALGYSHACMVRENDKVSCWGDGAFGQTGGASANSTVSGLPAVTAVFAKTDHSCAIAATGEPWCWGRNGQGQLGDGKAVADASPNPAPRKVLGWTGKAKAMALGADFTCALRDDGKAWCWGGAGQGQLGDGSAWKTAPTLVKGLP